MRALAISAILVLGLGCSSGQPDSQTPQGGPSASAADSAATEPAPTAAPVSPDPTPTAAPSATAPAPDPHELSLEKADVKKAVGKITPNLRKCLKKASKKDPDLKGQTMLTISIGADGTVSSVSASQSDGLTDKMIDCLKAAASKAKFEKPPAGSATVNLPLELEAKK